VSTTREKLMKDVLRCVSPEGVVFFVAKDDETPPANIGRPTNGGIRIQEYPDEATALKEACSLAKRMTHKQALYNVGFGGVKIVVSACLDGLDKHALMDAIAEVLQALDGTVYTGCDLNTDAADMDYLAQQSPYVLAGIGSAINPNETTAAGVYGTILGTVGQEALSQQRFLVHGIGKVGFALAQRLQQQGARILSYDINADQAQHPQFENVSTCAEWWALDFDVLVLCSASNIVTPAIAQQLNGSMVVGSSNEFFSEPEAVIAILQQRGILWIPEIVSSAGAVISDSIEHYAPDVFQQARPEDIYEHITQLTYTQTVNLLDNYHKGNSMQDSLNRLIYRETVEPVSGLTFQTA